MAIRTLMVLAIIAAAFNACLAQNRLNEKQKGIIAIAAFTAKGDLTQLGKAFHEGLNAGMSINETKEELIHLSAYCGFPRTLNAIITLAGVLDDRKREAQPIPLAKHPRNLLTQVSLKMAK